MATISKLKITDTANDRSGFIVPLEEDKVQLVWEGEEDSEEYTLDEFDALMETNSFEVEEITEESEDEEITEGVPAQDTIAAHGSADATASGEVDGNPKTRLDWITQIVDGLAGVDNEYLQKYYDMLGMVGGEGDRAGLGGKVSFNQASISMKPSAAMGKGAIGQQPMASMESVVVKLEKEETDKIFEETGLSDEAKAKMVGLFDSIVNLKLTEEKAKLAEATEKALQEQVEKSVETLLEAIDTYLNEAVEEWIKENQVAIESTLRSELTEDFIEAIKNLFVEHYVDIPEEKVEVLESVIGENEELKKKLNDSVNENINTKKEMTALKKSIRVAELSEGLTLVQKDKFKALVEPVELDEKFDEKVKVIKETFLAKPDSTSTVQTLVEGEDKPENKNNVVGDDNVLAIAKAFKSVKN